MKIWVLLVFSFNINHATLLNKEFYTKEACLAAAEIVNKSIQAVSPSPAASTTKAGCIEDTKPNE